MLSSEDHSLHNGARATGVNQQQHLDQGLCHLYCLMGKVLRKSISKTGKLRLQEKLLITQSGAVMGREGELRRPILRNLGH